MNQDNAQLAAGSSAPACSACGRPMILAEECVMGYQDHHVEGSRVTYCGACGPIPTMTLDEQPRSFRLVPNPKGLWTSAINRA